MASNRDFKINNDYKKPPINGDSQNTRVFSMPDSKKTEDPQRLYSANMQSSLYKQSDITPRSSYNPSYSPFFLSNDVYVEPAQNANYYNGVQYQEQYALDGVSLAANGHFVAFPWANNSRKGQIMVASDYTQRVYNFHKQNYPLILGHSGSIQDLQFAPFFDNILASASSDQTIKVWVIDEKGMQHDMNEGDEFARMIGHQNVVRNIQWNTKSNFNIASASTDLTVKIWDVNKEHESYNYEIFDNPQALEWNHDGQILSCVSKDSIMHLLDPRTNGKCLRIACEKRPQKQIKMKWIGNTGKIITLSTPTDNQGRYIQIFDMRSISEGPLIYKKLDDANFSSQIHYENAFNLFFVVNQDQSFCQYFQFIDGNEQSFNSNFTPQLQYIDKFEGKNLCKGMAFLPQRCLNHNENEAARAVRLNNGRYAESISFKVSMRNSLGMLLQQPEEEEAIEFDQWQNKLTSNNDPVYLEFEKQIMSLTQPHPKMLSPTHKINKISPISSKSSARNSYQQPPKQNFDNLSINNSKQEKYAHSQRDPKLIFYQKDKCDRRQALRRRNSTPKPVMPQISHNQCDPRFKDLEQSIVQLKNEFQNDQKTQNEDIKNLQNLINNIEIQNNKKLEEVNDRMHKQESEIVKLNDIIIKQKEECRIHKKQLETKSDEHQKHIDILYKLIDELKAEIENLKNQPIQTIEIQEPIVELKPIVEVKPIVKVQAKSKPLVKKLELEKPAVVDPKDETPILGYWDIRGVGQAIRYQMIYMGIEFDDFYHLHTDEYYQTEAWEHDKKQMGWDSSNSSKGFDFPDLPYFIHNKFKITNVLTIHQYISEKWMPQLLGKTINERSKIDMMANNFISIMNQAINNCYQLDSKEKLSLQLLDKAQEISNLLKNNKFLIGNEICYLDFIVFELLELIVLVTNSKVFQEFDNLSSYHHRIQNLPKLRDYIDSEDFLKAPFHMKNAKINNWELSKNAQKNHNYDINNINYL